MQVEEYGAIIWQDCCKDVFMWGGGRRGEELKRGGRGEESPDGWDVP